MTTKFLTDQKGKKVAVVIPIREYEDLLEDNYCAAIIGQRRNEETFPWEELEKCLIENEVLPA